MLNTDPTGFRAYFPWIHPQDWSYPAPNHSQGLLDGLGTTVNIVSHHTHTLVYFHRPAPPPPEFGLYHDEIPDMEWGRQEIHPADEIFVPGIKLQSDYFSQTEKDDPEDSHFTLWLTYSDIAINMHNVRVTIPKGTPVCLNQQKTSIGVPRGRARHDESKLVSYPRTWIHPENKYIDWNEFIKRNVLQVLPEVAGMSHTMNYPPDLD